MNNLTKMLAVIVVTVVVPLVILLGLWLEIIPQSVQVAIAMAGVALAIVFIIGGNLMLMWSDIKTGRYKKNS